MSTLRRMRPLPSLARCIQTRGTNPSRLLAAWPAQRPSGKAAQSSMPAVHPSLPGRERERKKERERARETERARVRASERARERESERARERERARETLLGSNVHSGGSWARSGDRYCNRRMNDLCTGTRCAPFLRTGTLKLLLPTVAPSSSKMKSHFKKSVEG